jgi:transposase
MMGRLKSDQGQLFYQFHLGDAVPEDHLARKIDAALDLSWLRSELAPHYSSMGRPSIDPELMIPDAGRGICLCDPFGAADLS